MRRDKRWWGDQGNDVVVVAGGADFLGPDPQAQLASLVAAKARGRPGAAGGRRRGGCGGDDGVRGSVRVDLRAGQDWGGGTAAQGGGEGRWLASA